MRIFLYREPRVENLRSEELADYLSELCPWAAVELREEFAGFWIEQLPEAEREAKLEDLAWAWAQARLGPQGRRTGPPLPMEVKYEKKRLRDPKHTASGLLYDALRIMAALRDLIAPEERTWRHLHLVFTNQLVASPDPGGRYHCRVAVFGYPCLISTSGAVEGPAKPREFYLAREQARILGASSPELYAYTACEPRAYLDYGDPRLTEVLKGYVAQAVAYHLRGWPFCEDRGCRLYNAHWQEEMLYAQMLAPYEFCTYHEKLFRRGVQEW